MKNEQTYARKTREKERTRENEEFHAGKYVRSRDADAKDKNEEDGQ